MNNNMIVYREKPIIDEICDIYHYDDNIRHILYVIIPAFVLKYGYEKESVIINTFKETKIISSNKEDNVRKAYYSSTPCILEGTYKTRKHMVIQNYNNITLIELIDYLVHEFNHAVNSYVNEMKTTVKYIYLRTGLTYRIYQKDTCTFIKKHSSYILEEIINTKQTADIINIIKRLDQSNPIISNTIYAINAETSNTYQSEAYYLQSYVCKEILANRTFISTLEKLRINGEVYEINKWFDDITGQNGSYKDLNELLVEIYNLEIKYLSQKYFKKRTIEKIRYTSDKIIKIINKFNQNVIFK